MFNPAEKWPTGEPVKEPITGGSAGSRKLPPQETTPIPEEKKKKIEQYLGENLPETEERMKESIDPNCEVSVVIPAYGERDYIFQLLESLTNQKGVNPSQYETIIVVNNPENEPKKTVAETDSDYERTLEHYHKALNENQEVLKLIRVINGENVEVELTDYEKQVIEKIKKLELRIFAIDKASLGKGLPEPNVGMARNRGVAEAIERFYKQLGKNGIIAQTDADTRLDKDYIQNLISVFEKRPELVGLGGEVRFGEIETKNELLKIPLIYSAMRYCYNKLSDDLVDKEVNLVEGKKDIHFSGANMASRAFEAAIVGGVPKLTGGEDPMFAKWLSKIGKIDRVDNIITMPANRPSPRTAVDAGHGQQILRTQESIQVGKTIKVESLERKIFVRKFNKRLNELINKQQVSPESLRQILSVDGQPLLDDSDLQLLSQKFKGVTILEKIRDDLDIRVIRDKANVKINELLPMVSLEEASSELIKAVCAKDEEIEEKYKVIKEDLIEKENSWIGEQMEMLENLLEIVFQDKPKDFNSQALMSIVKSNQERIRLNDEDVEKLNKNSSILNKLIRAIVNSKTEQEAMDKFKTTSRDMFTPLAENSLRFKLVELRAIDRAREELKKGEEFKKVKPGVGEEKINEIPEVETEIK